MRIGVIGAAGITGRALIEPARKLDEVEVAAVAARDPERAAKFAKEHEIRSSTGTTLNSSRTIHWTRSTFP